MTKKPEVLPCIRSLEIQAAKQAQDKATHAAAVAARKKEVMEIKSSLFHSLVAVRTSHPEGVMWCHARHYLHEIWRLKNHGWLKMTVLPPVEIQRAHCEPGIPERFDALDPKEQEWILFYLFEELYEQQSPGGGMLCPQLWRLNYRLVMGPRKPGLAEKVTNRITGALGIAKTEAPQT